MRYLFLILCFILVSFKPINICEVNKNAKKYCDMKEIVVKGKITKSFNLFGIKYYELSEGDCVIWVKPKSISPNKDSIIEVRGKLEEILSYNNHRTLVLKEF